MRGLLCRSLRTTLAARVLDTGEIPAGMRTHLAHCLRCQAVAAQSARLRRDLAGLEPRQPPPMTTGAASSRRWLAAGVASAAAMLVVSRLRHADG